MGRTGQAPPAPVRRPAFPREWRSPPRPSAAARRAGRPAAFRCRPPARRRRCRRRRRTGCYRRAADRTWGRRSWSLLIAFGLAGGLSWGDRCPRQWPANNSRLQLAGSTRKTVNVTAHVMFLSCWKMLKIIPNGPWRLLQPSSNYLPAGHRRCVGGNFAACHHCALSALRYERGRVTAARGRKRDSARRWLVALAAAVGCALVAGLAAPGVARPAQRAVRPAKRVRSPRRPAARSGIRRGRR